MKGIIALLVAVVALSATAAASASKCPPKKPDRGSHAPCVQWNKITHKCHTPGPGDGGYPPGGGDTTPPPPPVTAPAPPQENHEGYCVQTKERGETFVTAGLDSFKPGHDWYALWQSQASVVLDGHVVTLMLEDGKNGRQTGVGNGVILAANVPGVGLTCGQPYVDTNGNYAVASYGNR